MPRLNKVIELLEQGKVVFGGAIVAPGNIASATAFADWVMTSLFWRWSTRDSTSRIYDSRFNSC
jgi:hypothetical protein